jgi:hypothetical protein
MPKSIECTPDTENQDEGGPMGSGCDKALLILPTAFIVPLIA